MTKHPAAVTATESNGSDHWLNVPNAISVVRLLVMVPLVIWLMRDPELRIAATIALAVFGATDWIDGFWARKFNQVTRLGEIMDPVADRLGITIIACAMTVFGILPVWMFIVIVVVDVGLGIVGLIRLDATAKNKVSWIGKIRTALIMIGLPLLLLSTDAALVDTPLEQIAIYMLTLGVILHADAGILYANALIKAPREGHPSPTRD